jgi:hypothetical protein
MTPPSVLSSPFLTHSVLDTLLSQKLPAAERVQLLSAKIHLYANPPSREEIQADNVRRGTRDEARIPEMQTRMEIASVQKDQIVLDGASQAENTLRVVLEWTKGVMKGIERRRKLETQNGPEASGTEAAEWAGKNGDKDTKWIKEAMGIRKRALEMLIQLEEGSGRTSRIEALRRQLIEVDAAGFG